MTRRALALIAAVFALAMPAAGQVLRGTWVDETQRNIDRHRKVDVKLIVMDEKGKPLPLSPVRMTLLRHAFAWGIELDRSEFSKGSPLPAASWRDLPVWRCFSAVSLDDAGSWEQVQPTADRWDFEVVDRMVGWSEAGGLAVRWGSLTSADVGRLPAWAALLPAPALREALEQHVRQVVHRYGRRVEQFDVHTDTLRHRDVTGRLGIAMERRLYELARVGGTAVTAARFEDGLLGEPTQRMIAHVTAMREQFIPVQMLAIEAKLGGLMVQAPLARSLEWISALEMPVVICHLELQAGDAGAAALNLETALRTLFADPRVQGIYFGPIAAQRTGDESASLLDERGRATEAGAVFDRLVGDLWGTDLTLKADELGAIEARVFAGWYQITAMVGDVQARMEVYLPPRQPRRLIAVQPLKGAAAER
jgi:hypothetical protein